MSDTPRTDAHAIKWENYLVADPIPTREQPVEWYEFCRTLERELAAMTKERDQWHTHYRDEHERRLKLQDAYCELKRHAAALAAAMDGVELACKRMRSGADRDHAIWCIETRVASALAAYRASQQPKQ
jgi:hypothetical protein